VQGGPHDGSILELHSDHKAAVFQRLAVNHVSTCRVFVPRNNLYRIAKLPGANGVDASATWTDVIRVRTLFSIGISTYRWCEADYDYNRQPPFHSSTEGLVQKHFAQTLAGQT
jgi:hypothetical protein